jgi:hypothetical protein
LSAGRFRQLTVLLTDGVCLRLHCLELCDHAASARVSACHPPRPLVCCSSRCRLAFASEVRGQASTRPRGGAGARVQAYRLTFHCGRHGRTSSSHGRNYHGPEAGRTGDRVLVYRLTISIGGQGGRPRQRPQFRCTIPAHCVCLRRGIGAWLRRGNSGRGLSGRGLSGPVPELPQHQSAGATAALVTSPSGEDEPPPSMHRPRSLQLPPPPPLRAAAASPCLRLRRPAVQADAGHRGSHDRPHLWRSCARRSHTCARV